METLDQLKEEVLDAIIKKYEAVDLDARLQFMMDGTNAPDLPKRGMEMMAMLLFIFKTNPRMKEHEEGFDEIARSIFAFFNQDALTYLSLLTLLR